MRVSLDQSLKRLIRLNYINGTLSRRKLAQDLHLAWDTVNKYTKESEEIKRKCPWKLNNLNFWLPKTFPPRKSKMRDDLYAVLPDILANATGRKIFPLYLYPEYKKRCPDGYCFEEFREQFKRWIEHNNFCLYSHRRVKAISPEDLTTLKKWLNGSDRKRSERATIILGSFNGKTMAELVTITGRRLPVVLNWIDNFNRLGLEGLLDKPYIVNDRRIAVLRQKQANISKLLHESPKLHGIDRQSWKLDDFVAIYKKIYQQYICNDTVSRHLKMLGYRYVKSREKLTSPDPKFREKVDHIKKILADLKDDEKFFSIDEFGHFAIKMRGGWGFAKPGEEQIIPPKQKSRGVLLMTAALELSGNQITHFYSGEKNTDEMIKLIKILIEAYPNASKLYLSWDAAKWHSSNKLKAEIEHLNSPEYRAINKNPSIHLAPLPSSAQFLNVIESIFCGMAKSVLHHSDFQNVDECKIALDSYINERNQHFRENPHRAGRYLWGAERTKAQFNEANNCKGRLLTR